MNILLTGVPGVGKTTVMEKLAGLIESPAGFVTSELREAGRRVGFTIRTFDGREGLLARREKSRGPRVGPYAVFLKGLDKLGVDAIRAGIESGSVILVDEIGKMEAKSSAFRSAVTEALESGCDVVATLGVSEEPFLREVRRRPDVSLVEVTRANRDRLPGEILAALGGGH